MLDAVAAVAAHGAAWAAEYEYSPRSNEYVYHAAPGAGRASVGTWFDLSGIG